MAENEKRHGRQYNQKMKPYFVFQYLMKHTDDYLVLLNSSNTHEIVLFVYTFIEIFFIKLHRVLNINSSFKDKVCC